MGGVGVEFEGSREEQKSVNRVVRMSVAVPLNKEAGEFVILS